MPATRLFARPGTRKNPVCRLGVGRLFLPKANETLEQRHHWHWSFAGFTLWLTNVVDVIAFGGSFSGNAIGASRSIPLRITTN
jgi:hypothetical protein